MTTPASIADLRNAFYGGSVDAEYDYLASAVDDGYTAASINALNFGDRPASGQENINRKIPISSITMTSQAFRLSFFTAYKTETVNNITVMTSSTGAGATPTVIRFGIYSVADNGDVTLIGSTPNDTTLLASTNTLYTKAFSAGVTLVAGTRYAIGAIVVTAAAAPTLVGVAQVGTQVEAILPRVCGQKTGQSDLPSSMTEANISASGNFVYALVTP